MVVGQAFDKAIQGLKKDELAGMQNLGMLLASMAAATDDGTQMLAGFSFVSSSAIYSILKNFTTVDPSMKDFLGEASKEFANALTELKPELTKDDPNPRVVLAALGKVARITFQLQERMTQIQRLPPLGMGGGHGE